MKIRIFPIPALMCRGMLNTERRRAWHTSWTELTGSKGSYEFSVVFQGEKLGERKKKESQQKGWDEKKAGKAASTGRGTMTTERQAGMQRRGRCKEATVTGSRNSDTKWGIYAHLAQILHKVHRQGQINSSARQQPCQA